LGDVHGSKAPSSAHSNSAVGSEESNSNAAEAPSTVAERIVVSGGAGSPAS
jgi:hypothetical protein